MRIQFLFACLALSLLGSSQPVRDSLQRPDNLAAKIRTQKTIYHATSITGAVLMTVGGIMFLYEMGKNTAEFNEGRANTGEVLFYSGAGLTLASIPFRIAYRRNKNLAGSFSPRIHPANVSVSDGSRMRDRVAITMYLRL